MTNLTIKQLKEMFIQGANVISSNYEYINELNVFPVPDGDTGSNLKITCDGAIDFIKTLEFSDLFNFGKQFSRALLMNARGNSGVIFSQIIKGFVSTFKENAKTLTMGEFIDSFSKAKEIAYKSVVAPIEGTILTIIRVVSEELNKKRLNFKSIEEISEFVVQQSEIILNKTPEFLIELKEAGVVDSGGYGLWCFFKGMNEALISKKSNVKQIVNKTNQVKLEKKDPVFIDKNDGFGYCCEFILKLGAKVILKQKNKEKYDEEELKKLLLNIGDSLAIVRDEEILKVHIHSLNPHQVLSIGQKYGEFSKIKIENMTFQFLEKNPNITLETINKKKANNSISNKPKIIVTVPTQLLENQFKDDFNVDYVINCKANGNPSIQEFLTAINHVKSKNIILFIDDSNMILAAKEAIELVKNTDNTINVQLISTGDIVASYLACSVFNPEINFNDNLKTIHKKLKSAAIGKVSKSVKKIKYSHIDVDKNDYIAIINKKIINASKNLDSSLSALVQELIKSNKKAKQAIIIYGNEMFPTNLNQLRKNLKEKYGIKDNFIKSDENIYISHITLI